MHASRSTWRGELLEAAAHVPAWLALGIGVALVAILAVADYVTGSEISFSIFYLGPVLLVTWLAGRVVGAAVAIVSAATWGVVDVLAGASYSSPWIPVWNSAVRLGFFAVALALLGELRRANALLHALATTDPLTGARNARAFYDALDREIARSRRSGRPFTVVYADLDRFKAVNDAQGHAAGDALLRGVARALLGAVRETDAVARLGGDEFAVLLPETDPAGAAIAAGRAFEAAQAAIREAAPRVEGAGVSLGAATFLSPPESSDAAVAAADAAMYAGKTDGRGAVRLSVVVDVAARAGAERRGKVP